MFRSHLVLAWRVLARRKLFTAISMFGIALTMTVLVVASAMLDHIFATHPPESRMGRTLGIYQIELRSENRAYTGFSGYALLDRYMRDIPGVDVTSFFTVAETVESYQGNEKIRSYRKRTDGNYWRILDFQFLEGGPFTATDDAQGNPVAVINASTRERFFGSGATAVGRDVDIEGQRFRVVGVVPDVPIVRLTAFADVWVPLSTARTSGWRETFDGAFIALFLAADHDAFPAIRREVKARLATVQTPDPSAFTEVHGNADTLFEAAARFILGNDSRGTHTSTAPLEPRPTDPQPGQLLLLLSGLALLFMTLPAVNLTNLNLSRILERSGEIGVRKAFGAPRVALVGQFLLENLVLTACGGAVGMVTGRLALAALNWSGLVPYAAFALNWRVVLWGMAAMVVFAVVSGVYPAWRMSRLDPVQALRGRS